MELATGRKVTFRASRRSTVRGAAFVTPPNMAESYFIMHGLTHVQQSWFKEVCIIISWD